MTDDTNPRRRVRRTRGGFSSSGVSDSMSAGDPVAEEDRESRPSPTPINRQVKDKAAGGEEDFTPSSRLSEVQQYAPEYTREYKLQLIHRLLMRRVPMDQIADQLDVSVRTCYRLREELFTELRKSASDLDMDELVGESLGFYDEARAMSMRLASGAKTPVPHRLAAIRTAVAATNDKHRFLNTAGVYDVLQYKPGSSRGNNEIQRLMELTRNVLTGETEETQAAARAVVEDEEEIRII